MFGQVEDETQVGHLISMKLLCWRSLPQGSQDYSGSHSIVKREPPDIKAEYNEPQDIKPKYMEQIFKVKTEYEEQTFKAEPQDKRIKAESQWKSNGANQTELQLKVPVSFKKESLTWFEKKQIRKWKKEEKRQTRERGREKLEKEKLESEKVAACKEGARRAEEAAAQAQARQKYSSPSFETLDEALDEDMAGDLFSWSPPPSP